MMVKKKIGNYVRLFIQKARAIGCIWACMFFNCQCMPGVDVLSLLSYMSNPALQAVDEPLDEDHKQVDEQDYREEIPFVKLSLLSDRLFFYSGSRVLGRHEDVPYLSEGSDLYHDWLSRLMMPDTGVIYEEGNVYMVRLLKRRIGRSTMRFKLLCIPISDGDMENITLLPMRNRPGIIGQIVWENILERVRLEEERTLFDRVMVIDICHKMTASYGFALPKTYMLEPVADVIQSVGSKASRTYLFCQSTPYRPLRNDCYYVDMEKEKVPRGYVPWFQGTYKCRMGALRVKFTKACNKDGDDTSFQSMLYFASDQSDEKIDLGYAKHVEENHSNDGIRSLDDIV